MVRPELRLAEPRPNRRASPLDRAGFDGGTAQTRFAAPEATPTMPPTDNRAPPSCDLAFAGEAETGRISLQPSPNTPGIRQDAPSRQSIAVGDRIAASHRSRLEA